MREGRIVIRGIDRTDDYRIVCAECKRDMGGTVAARPGHKIHEVVCERCKYGTFENFLAQHQQRLNDLSETAD